MTSRERVGFNRRQPLTTCASDCLSLKSSVTKARAGKDAGGGGEGGEAKVAISDDEEKVCRARVEIVALEECGDYGDKSGCSCCYSTGC